MNITEAQAQDFVKYASNPDTWVLAARRSFAVAQLLIARARELQLVANHDFFEFSGCYYTGYFHAGVALENAAKAVLISRDPAIVRKDGLNVRKFGGTTGHELLGPLQSVLGALSDEEASFITKLEEFVWMGRYTVPRKAASLFEQEKRSNARISSPRELPMLQSLVERVLAQLPNQAAAT